MRGRIRGQSGMEFSKKSLIFKYFVSLVLVVSTIIGAFMGYDVTALAALAGGSILIDGYDTKHYFWKARNENRAKYAQRFVLRFADKYGIEAALRLAETVLKE